MEPPQGEGRRRPLHHRAEPPSPVCRFLAEQSVKDPHARVERKKLYEAYVNWLKEPGATAVLSRDQFYMQIRSMGFVERPRKGGRRFFGLRLAGEGEEEGGRARVAQPFYGSGRFAKDL